MTEHSQTQGPQTTLHGVRDLSFLCMVRWEGSRKAKAPGLELEFGGSDPRLTGSSPTRILGRRSLPSVQTREPSAGKPVGGDWRTVAARPTEKSPSPRSDGDAETNPFAGRRPVPDYVMPEPAVQATSPSREVLAVIEVAGGSHV